MPPPSHAHVWLQKRDLRGGEGGVAAPPAASGPGGWCWFQRGEVCEMCEGNKALSSPTSPRLSSPCSYTLSAACIAAETMGDPNEREPCPHRIIDDVGTAFSMGAIGGTFWHAFKGARSSPKGERLYGSVTGACSVCVFVAFLSLVTPPPPFFSDQEQRAACRGRLCRVGWPFFGVRLHVHSS